MNNINNTRVSSFDSKSCYRLYAGHSNWINLDAKTTQDLLKIFQKGDPCKYQLEPGLFIDIIPNDVDCNSKNIDMIGLMRADLVYEPSSQSENQVQQQMSHYVRSLLDDQGIIDAFPPLRKGEDLPAITSIPTHRHLSLVPSVIGSVRRGPKSNQTQHHTLKNPSSASSEVNEDGAPSSSSSFSHGCNRKRATSHAKRTTNKRTRPAEYNSASKRQVITLGSPNMVNTSFVTHCSPMLNLKPFVNNDEQHTYNHHSASMIPLDFQHQQEESTSTDTHFWTTSSTYQHTPSYSQQRPFPFEMDLEFGHMQQRQSPTDILNEYHHGFYNYPHHKVQAKPSGHFVSSDTNSLESFVPTSPIQNWLDEDNKNNVKQEDRNSGWIPAMYPSSTDNKTNRSYTENMTTLPVIERMILQQDDNNNVLFSHANKESSS